VVSSVLEEPASSVLRVQVSYGRIWAGYVGGGKNWVTQGRVLLLSKGKVISGGYKDVALCHT
jgi:hypothetical protein